jgi:hypothetical protein
MTHSRSLHADLEVGRVRLLHFHNDRLWNLAYQLLRQLRARLSVAKLFMASRAGFACSCQLLTNRVLVADHQAASLTCLFPASTPNPFFDTHRSVWSKNGRASTPRQSLNLKVADYSSALSLIKRPVLRLTKWIWEQEP